MAIYSGPAYLIVRGRPALQSDSIDVSFKSGNTRVKTLLLGEAGHSAGAAGIELSISGAVPEDGLEVDWPALVLAQSEVAIGVRFAGKTYSCVGDVTDAKLTSGVDKANTHSVTFNGRVVGIL